MNNNAKILRILSLFTLAAALLSATALRASEVGTIMLDGKLETEEGGLTDATVTVYQDDVQSQQLTIGLDHFGLELELGHAYRIAFSKPGCLTKELQLDAHAPIGMMNEHFGFLFRMTLKAGKGDYAYDGPVAVIHFDNKEMGFNYDRTHASPKLIKNEPQARGRKEAKAFADPTAELATWVEQKRSAE